MRRARKPLSSTASGVTSMTSVASARFRPAPTAPPTTADTVGTGRLPIRTKAPYTAETRATASDEAGAADETARSRVSAPLQKYGPTEATTTAPIDSSCSTRSQHSPICAAISSVIAPFRSGLSRVIRAMEPSTANSTRGVAGDSVMGNLADVDSVAPARSERPGSIRMQHQRLDYKIGSNLLTKWQGPS